MISQPEPLMMPELQVGGKRRVAEALPYINTERCMKAFNTMSCDARYLGLINAEDLIDRRNAEPIIYCRARRKTTPRWQRAASSFVSRSIWKSRI
jgi:hypothetical protein